MLEGLSDLCLPEANEPDARSAVRYSQVIVAVLNIGYAVRSAGPNASCRPSAAQRSCLIKLGARISEQLLLVIRVVVFVAYWLSGCVE